MSTGQPQRDAGSEVVPLREGIGSAEVAAAIVMEIRARREGLADDERRVRRHPYSRQILTGRQREHEAAFIGGLLLALTHALGQPYDITAAEQLVSKGAGQ